MKLKKVINLCKQEGKISLFDGDGRQWLSDSFAVYPLENMPIFNIDSICSTFDITEKKKEKLITQHYNSLPSKLDFSDTSLDEELCEISSIKITINGTSYVQIMTSMGCEFIDGKYLAPFADTNPDMLRIYARVTSDGHTYFAVKDGLILIGIITPSLLINQNTLNALQQFVKRCELHLKNKTEAEDGEA